MPTLRGDTTISLWQGAGCSFKSMNTRKPLWWECAKRQEDRFWSLVKKGSGCWIWIAGRDKDGYGKFAITLPRVNGKEMQKHVRAHRLAYLFAGGMIEPGRLVLHSCDNPACCNPNHLRSGTQLQNRADAVLKWRQAYGERHPMAKLSERQARELIRMKARGVPAKEIALRFRIAVCTVHQIGVLNWKHLSRLNP